MTTFKWLASCVLAANMVPALPAKTHCPGNVASVPLHLLNGYQMVVAVSVNPFRSLPILVGHGHSDHDHRPISSR
jgi:hypothetical protein